jgi:cell division protein FtsL
MPAAALKRQHDPTWHEDFVPVATPTHKPVQSEEEARQAARSRATRRRAKQRHKPLRLSITTALCSLALLGQLTMLLYLHGRALSASRESGKLDQQIKLVENQIGRTEKQIAVQDSSAHLEDWAKERGWKLADHRDFDDVTKLHPMPVSQAPIRSTSDGEASR